MNINTDTIKTGDAKTPVKVVIPIYTSSLNGDERRSLRQTMEVLGKWPRVFVVPQSLDTAALEAEWKPSQVIRVSDQWLGRANGIAGYNRMMLAREFYELFADCEYILVCQTDVWIFRDELAEWCGCGYDYIGAPWIKRSIYNRPIIRQWLVMRRRLADRKGVRLRQHLFDKVGNGGLSLRRVSSFIGACDRLAGTIDLYNSRSGHLWHEDVFWATEPTGFRYPDLRQALGFAFDTNPAFCLRTTGGKLPFGCHAWSKPRYRKFWEQYIK